jgi:hypothetical protein
MLYVSPFMVILTSLFLSVILDFIKNNFLMKLKPLNNFLI